MRLPESITGIAPVGALLKAQEAGEALLAKEVERHEARLLVEQADAQGLSRWEADYGLPDWSGTSAALRRLRLRGAMAGGQTLTPARLRALVCGMTGAQSVRIREDHAAYRTEVTVEGRALPEAAALTALQQVLHRQKPAHLEISLQGSTDMEMQHHTALWGRMLCIFTAGVEDTAT